MDLLHLSISGRIIGIKEVRTTDIHGDIMSGKFPRIKVEPVIGHFNLIAIDNLLLEDTIPISQTVAPSREVKRRQAVEEASG